MKKLKKAVSMMMLAIMSISLSTNSAISIAASSTTDSSELYPVQEVNIVSTNGTYLSYEVNKGVTTAEENNGENQNWKLVYVKDSVYKIVNSANEKVLTASNGNCEFKTDQDSTSQYWFIEAVDYDVLGYALTYKVINYANSSYSLTTSEDGSISLASYKNTTNQKWRLNSAGLQGFAGYSIDMDGNEKSSTIGGVLGKTVYVETVSDLEKYATGDTPTTIVIKNNLIVDVPADYQHLDSDEKLLTKIKVGKNKTIIGAYGVSIANIYFYLDKTSDSGNFIIKNITIKHDETLDLNNFIPMYISQGENFWIDHCTFEGHDSYSSENGTIQEIHQQGIDEDNHAVDKFVYVGVKADYVTISESKFTNHEYGLILGYPNENSEEIMDTYTGYPRMTISGNYFTRMYCRAPGLMRYGYFHTVNNYVEDAHLAFTLYTRATVYSESNYFSSVKGILDDKICAGFTDVGSYPTVTATKSPATTWTPSENYSYNALSATAAQEYCTTYSGAQDSAENFKYISDLFSTYVADEAEDSADDTIITDTVTEGTTDDSSTEVVTPASELHSFTLSDKTSSFFTINGSLSSSKGSVTYNGMTLTKCLKIESSTNISFTTTADATLTLVFNSTFTGDINVDGVAYSATNGIATISLSAGDHIIKKADTCNLYFMQVDYN